MPWDTFFNRAKKEVVIQFDTGNGVAQGGDPVVYLKKKPGRVASVHVKPYSKAKPNALIGDDELPWKEILHSCETTAGVEWYIIEYESDPNACETTKGGYLSPHRFTSRLCRRVRLCSIRQRHLSR